MLTIHTEERNNKVSIPKHEFEILLKMLHPIEEVKIIKDDFSDLISASATSLEFWNNKRDDEVWNNA